MSDEYSSGPLLDMFLFETTQLIEQLEACILNTENIGYYSRDVINEIFRIMHTIKGSSAMMRYENISLLAHSIEDMFYFLREENVKDINYSELSDLVLASVDFIKEQIEKIRGGSAADDDASMMITNNKDFLTNLKEPSSSNNMYSYRAVIHFQEGSEMENIRAYNVVHNLKDIAGEIKHIPEDVLAQNATEIIRRDGFILFMKSNYTYVDVHQLLMQTIFLKELDLEELNTEETEQMISNQIQDSISLETQPSQEKLEASKEETQVKLTGTEHNLQQTIQGQNLQSQSMQSQDMKQSLQQSIISVPVTKLDLLMNLMGEFVITEAMVTQNPDLKGLKLENFRKATRQLSKITNELQDVIMSIRMVPLSATFHKMNRVIRDMSKKLNKNVKLSIIGEDTEVDKNIIEHISDPLMHLVRNAIDHGIESPQERVSKGKPEAGTITLEAKNAGSDVLVIVKDDGKGLNKEKLLNKAKQNGLLYKPESDMSDKEIYNLIFHPGFSTNESVTEFSGRGVGMDVVVKNIETIGGIVSSESVPGEGLTIIMKIPLTLAIIDGMNIKLGCSSYTIPTINIRESFRPNEKNIFSDPDGNEMIMVRGQCYPILRLYELFQVDTDIKEFSEGIIIMIEQDENVICLFVDELLGQQQVVVKALPEYVRRFSKSKGLAGCTLLGDGSISLILDIAGLVGFRELVNY